MNLTLMRRVSEREPVIRQFVIVKNKLMSVFNASVLLLIMNFVITLSKQSADPFTVYTCRRRGGWDRRRLVRKLHNNKRKYLWTTELYISVNLIRHKHSTLILWKTLRGFKPRRQQVTNADQSLFIQLNLKLISSPYCALSRVCLRLLFCFM